MAESAKTYTQEEMDAAQAQIQVLQGVTATLNKKLALQESLGDKKTVDVTIDGQVKTVLILIPFVSVNGVKTPTHELEEKEIIRLVEIKSEAVKVVEAPEEKAE